MQNEAEQRAWYKARGILVTAMKEAELLGFGNGRRATVRALLGAGADLTVVFAGFATALSQTRRQFSVQNPFCIDLANMVITLLFTFYLKIYYD